MVRLVPVLALVLAGCASFGGAQKVSGDENQVVLSGADQQKAQQHCASFGKDAINLGPAPGGSNVTYACRPRRT
ncbi:MAG TPA: hypothetical protein VHM01_03360 [Alphaproteobacteria bacterium]|nr:hypothetical protein [Alphaproteobacteria bacterium]